MEKEITLEEIESDPDYLEYVIGIVRKNEGIFSPLVLSLKLILYGHSQKEVFIQKQYALSFVKRIAARGYLEVRAKHANVEVNEKTGRAYLACQKNEREV